MTQHTPGPWNIEFGDSVYSQADYAALSQRGHTAHALCTIHAIPLSKGDTDANARLIAAAPDLLELLDEAYDRFTDNDMQPANTKLRAWLTRAEAVFDRLRATGENLQKSP